MRLPSVLRFVLSLGVFSSTFCWATWLGPTVESIQTTNSSTALDVVKEVYKAVEQSEESIVSFRIEVSDEELESESVGLWVKEIPAMLVLKYLADQCIHEFVFEEGIWVYRNPPIKDRRYDDNIVTLKVAKCEPEKLEMLGLKAKETGEVVVTEGKKWPNSGRATFLDGVLVVQTMQWEADCLLALLTLIEHGFSVPKINS